jgi:membrane-associated phospholipid phosphatase
MSARAPGPIAIFMVLFFLALFVGLAALIQAGHATAFDAFVRDRVHDFASPGLTTAMTWVTLLGSPIVLGSLTILLFGFSRWAEWRETASHLAWTMIGAAILENALKFAFQRARPEPFFGIVPPETYSFPSGHSLFSACFYCVVTSEIAGHINGRAGAASWTFTMSLIAAIGFSRIYLGVHYPTDVIAGYIVAVFWLAAQSLTTPYPAQNAP